MLFCPISKAGQGPAALPRSRGGDPGRTDGQGAVRPGAPDAVISLEEDPPGHLSKAKVSPGGGRTPLFGCFGRKTPKKDLDFS